MRLLKDKKAQVRVIEAFFASMILLSVLTLIPQQKSVNNAGDADLSSTAQQVLLTLDNDGYLSRLIESGNWTQIRQCVQSTLPPTIWFNLTILSQDNVVLNDVPMSSGSSSNQETYSYDYLCVSQNANYAIYTVRLQLAVVS